MDFERVVEKAAESGCKVEFDGKGHRKITTPGGVRVSCSASPSDQRAGHRLRADLKRAGVMIDNGKYTPPKQRGECRVAFSIGARQEPTGHELMLRLRLDEYDRLRDMMQCMKDHEIFGARCSVIRADSGVMTARVELFTSRERKEPGARKFRFRESNGHSYRELLIPCSNPSLDVELTQQVDAVKHSGEFLMINGAPHLAFTLLNSLYDPEPVIYATGSLRDSKLDYNKGPAAWLAPAVAVLSEPDSGTYLVDEGVKVLAQLKQHGDLVARPAPTQDLGLSVRVTVCPDSKLLRREINLSFPTMGDLEAWVAQVESYERK